MTIEEKYQNAIDLLHNLSKLNESGEVEITSVMLEQNGLGGDDFWEIIVPRLENDGLIKKYVHRSPPEYQNQFKADAIMKDLRRLAELEINSELGGGIFNPLSRGGMHVSREREKETCELKTLKKDAPKLKEALDSMVKVYNFIVDGKKLANVAKASSKPLTSIHLVSASSEPSTEIFLVLDERFGNPIRCAVKNSGGGVTYMKRLYDIAYPWNVPGKSVNYDKQLADNINNGLFRIPRVKQYMATNKFKKPTLVEKSQKNTLVLKGEIQVKTERIQNIQTQLQPLYIDKTK